MEETKFRAFHLRRRRMLAVVEMDLSCGEISGRWLDGSMEDTGKLPIEACDLMRSTGMLDMKGTEIYEGDIVDDTHGRIGIFQSSLTVKWDEKEDSLGLVDAKGKRIPWKTHLQEVIGNVYQKRFYRP
ncbi:MAG: hypothetical protein JXL84_23065 [Deltaproteobacteria bacterium]|nr:hypothetical protein [Deltaproteobacteria bacterium]